MLSWPLSIIPAAQNLLVGDPGLEPDRSCPSRNILPGTVEILSSEPEYFLGSGIVAGAAQKFPDPIIWS